MNKRTALVLFLLSWISLRLPAQNTLVRNSDDELFRTGVELMNNEKYGAARDFFQRYISLHKRDLKSVDAEYFLAYCAMNLYHSDTESLFQAFLRNHPEHSRASLAYYDLGTFNYRNGSYQKAIEYFEKVDLAKLSPSQKVERDFKLGYSYFSQKQFDYAVPYFNEVKHTENKYTYSASYYAGYIEFRSGKYDEALTDLRKAEQNEGYRPLVPPIIANIYYWQGSYDELIAYSEKILASDDKSIQGKDDIFLLTADAYYMKQNYKKASEYFQKLLQQNKSKVTPEIRYRLGYSLYKNREVDAAAEQFKELAGNKDSLQQAAAYYLGVVYLNQGKKDYALTAFDLARKTSFSRGIQEEALFNYGKVSFDLRRYHEAISALRTFSREFPQSGHSAEVQELLSESFLRTSNYPEAISYIESLKVRSLRINAAYQKVTYYYGVQLYNNGQFEEAIKLFNKSAEFPIDKDTFLAANFWKGEAYSVLKDYPAAVNSYATVFQKAEEGNEYYLKSRYGIGYAYFNMKEYDKALPHFKKYTERLKNEKNRQFYYDALLRLADLHFYNKKYDQAVAAYDEAIAGRIHDADYAYFQKGVVDGIQRKNDEAEKSFDMVIQHYPQSVYHDDAMYEKAQLNFREGNFEKAEQLFTQLIEQKPGSPYIPYAYLRRAGVYTDLGKDDKGIADYEYILTNYISHPVADDALLGLQDLYNKTGRTEDLRKWEAEIEKVNPKNELLVTTKFNYGTNYYFAKKYKQAIEAFNNFINTYPDNGRVTEARYFLGNSYLSSGDTVNAEKNYNLVIDARDPNYTMPAVQRMAEIRFEKGKYEEAKPYYQILLANANSKVEKVDALVGLMISYYNMGAYDSTIYYGSQVKGVENASVDAESESLLYLGKAYYAKEDFGKATDYFLSTLNLAKDQNGAEAQYHIAEIQYRQKKYRQSLETIQQLSSAFSDYDYWIGKAFLLASENFIALNEKFQAKATLKSLIDNSPEKEIVEEARKKLEILEGKEKGAHE